MASYEYDRGTDPSTGLYLIGTKAVSAAVKDEWPDKTFEAKCSGSNIELDFDVDLTTGEKTTLDQIISDTKTSWPLQREKSIKNGDIDSKTDDIIAEGYIFDSNLFSLSANAQINIAAIKQASDAGWVAFPVAWSTKTDGEYSVSEADFPAFYGRALAAKKYALDSGRALKVQVNACTTVAQVLAIDDDRVVQPYNP